MAKGSILDLGAIIVIVAILVITWFLSSLIFNKFWEKYNETNPSQEEQHIMNKGSSAFNIGINMIPFVMIGSGIGAIVLAFLIPSHPVFLPLSIIALVIFMALSVVFSNVLYDFLNSSMLVGIANQYSLVVSIVKFLPHIITVFGVVIIIVMYSKAGRIE